VQTCSLSRDTRLEIEEDSQQGISDCTASGDVRFMVRNGSGEHAYPTLRFRWEWWARGAHCL
jgi:hypothetical protein